MLYVISYMPMRNSMIIFRNQKIKALLCSLLLVFAVKINFSFAEAWVEIGESDIKLGDMLNKVDKTTGIGEKYVIEALKTNDYKTMVDTESIRTTRDGSRESNIKLEFINEINIPSSDQTVKYVMANMKFNCDGEIIWFVDGGAYDINDNLVRSARTVFVPADLKKHTYNSKEKELFEFICMYNDK